ncbi:DNA-(apurinic or apyrimidinic site) lyase [Rhizina undulata]
MVRPTRSSAAKVKAKLIPASESNSELSAPLSGDELARDSQTFNTQTLAKLSVSSQSKSQSQLQLTSQGFKLKRKDLKEEEVEEKTTGKNTRKRARKEVDTEVKETAAVVKKARKQKKVSCKEEEEEEAEVKEEEEEEKEYLKEETTKVKASATKPGKQLAGAKKKAEMSSLAARTFGLNMLVGAHVSVAQGVFNAITNSQKIGGNAFALFLKNQRRWVSKDYTEADIIAFQDLCKKHNYDAKKHVLPHGSYLINLAQIDKDKAEQAYECFVDDLKRCEKLGIGLYNFHPGSTLGHPRKEALSRIATALNKAHKETTFVRTVLENMAGAGNVIGGDFEDLRDIIEQVEDKSRVGVCLDTCHLFAAGHDIRTESSFAKVMSNFDRIIGSSYLCALHLNDSKAQLGAKRDLHQNIGKGFLGLEPFRIIMNDKRFEGMPMVLETPTEDDGQVWAAEIKLLEGLIGKGPDDEEFIRDRERLAKSGAAERKTMDEKLDKKGGKAAVQKGKGKRVGKKKEADEDEDEDEEHSC